VKERKQKIQIATIGVHEESWAESGRHMGDDLLKERLQVLGDLRVLVETAVEANRTMVLLASARAATAAFSRTPNAAQACCRLDGEVLVMKSMASPNVVPERTDGPIGTKGTSSSTVSPS
jgi:hypothetical protein